MAFGKYKNLKAEMKEGILTLTINRPEKMNALNRATIEELRDAIQEVYDDKDIKGVIITGEGEEAFIAGADITEIAELNEVNGRKFSESGQEVFSLIEKCDKPIIAAVNGYALGGGCELAMACHMRVATENAEMGQPEVNLGIIPGFGGTQRLTQLVGKGKALEIMMTADKVSAQEAWRIMLVNHLVPDKKTLLSYCRELIEKISSKAPLAIGMVVDCVNAVYNHDENGFQTEANSFAACCKSKDFDEGTAAFLSKRPAQFKGE